MLYDCPYNLFLKTKLFSIGFGEQMKEFERSDYNPGGEPSYNGIWQLFWPRILTMFSYILYVWSASSSFNLPLLCQKACSLSSQSNRRNQPCRAVRRKFDSRIYQFSIGSLFYYVYFTSPNSLTVHEGGQNKFKKGYPPLKV